MNPFDSVFSNYWFLTGCLCGMNLKKKKKKLCVRLCFGKGQKKKKKKTSNCALMLSDIQNILCFMNYKEI